MKFRLLTTIGLGIASFGCAFGGVAAWRLDENTLAAVVMTVVTATIIAAVVAAILFPLAAVIITYINSRKGALPPGQPTPPPPQVVIIGQQQPPYQVERNGHEPLPLPSGPREFTIIGDSDDDE